METVSSGPCRGSRVTRRAGAEGGRPKATQKIIVMDRAEHGMIDPEDVCGAEWAEWYLMPPERRWQESQRLWVTYLALGGTLDPEPDTQSPFFDERAPRPIPPDGRPGMRVLRRSRV